MLPSARIHSAIELLSALLASWQRPERVAADQLLHRYFKARRFIGSKDRATIAELFYWTLRHKAALEWQLMQHGMPSNEQDAELSARHLIIAALLFKKDADAKELGGLLDGSRYGPPALHAREAAFASKASGKPLEHAAMPISVRLNYPVWLQPYLEETFKDSLEEEMRAFDQQAAVDLRANTLKISRDELLEKLRAQDIDASPSPFSPDGIRLSKRAPVFTLPEFKQGLFEMQDAGSQMIARLVDAEPGMRVIDFCAGAGGKTLAIAAAMQNKGRILALDTSMKRLAELKPRLARAGVDTVQTHVLESESDSFLKRHKQTTDRVLIDVPCSGTGTWRRNPDLKWRFSESDLREVLDVQMRILESSARLVRPGGRLIYATCSLLRAENENQVESFLKTRSNFAVVSAEKIWNKSLPKDAPEDAMQSSSPSPFLRLTPHQDGTDGFFAAALERLA